MSLKLTGFWTADDGGLYYLRQISDELWWVGLSDDAMPRLQKGFRFCNVFHGFVDQTSVQGEWADVPRGLTNGAGSLVLQVDSETRTITKQSGTGGFSATTWTVADLPPASEDIFSVFDQVKKNQKAALDHSLLDNLKPCRSEAVVIFGNVLADERGLSYHVNYPDNAGRAYADFICLYDNNSPPDGDLNFDVALDRAQLDAQIGFWSEGWETEHGVTPAQIRAKLDFEGRAGGNYVHAEAIMFGRTAECGDGGYDSPPLLPGWQEENGDSVLVNGRPLNGDITSGNEIPGAGVTGRLAHKALQIDQRVRVSGVLALDCGHGATRPCHEDEPDVQNLEIHPVYAIDIVDTRAPEDLSGAWAISDGGTCYVHIVGSTVWMLALPPFRNRSYATVFRGTLNADVLACTFVDLPLGVRQESGELTLDVQPGNVQLAPRAEGVFGAPPWEKLYDAAGHPFSVAIHPELTCEGSAFGFVEGTDARFVAVTSPQPGLSYEWKVQGATAGAGGKRTFTAHALPPAGSAVSIGVTVAGPLGCEVSAGFGFITTPVPDPGVAKTVEEFCRAAAQLEKLRHYAIINLGWKPLWDPDRGEPRPLTDTELARRQMLISDFTRLQVETAKELGHHG